MPVDKRQNQQHSSSWLPGYIFGVATPKKKVVCCQIIDLPVWSGFVPVAVYNWVLPDIDPHTSVTAIPPGSAIASLCVERLCLDTGEWPILGSAPIELPRSAWPHIKFLTTGSLVGLKSYSSLILDRFCGAWLGEVPWNCMKDPQYFDRLLLPGVVRPAKVRLE